MALERIIIAKKFILTWMCVLKYYFFRKIASNRPINPKKWINKWKKKNNHTTMNNKLFLFWCKQVVSIIFYYSTFTSRMGNRNREEREEKKLWILFFSTEYSMSSSTVKWNDRFLSILAVDEVALHWGDVFP